MSATDEDSDGTPADSCDEERVCVTGETADWFQRACSTTATTAAQLAAGGRGLPSATEAAATVSSTRCAGGRGGGGAKSGGVKGSASLGRVLVVNTSATRYHIVRTAAIAAGFAVEDGGRAGVPVRFWPPSQQLAAVQAAGQQGPKRGGTGQGSISGSKTSFSGRPSTVARTGTASGQVTAAGSGRSAIRQQQQQQQRSGTSDTTNRKGGVATGTRVPPTSATSSTSSGSDNDDDDDGQRDPLEALRRLYGGPGGPLAGRAAATSGGGAEVAVMGPAELFPAMTTDTCGMLPRVERALHKRAGGRARFDPQRHCQVQWTDMSVLEPRVAQLRPHQRLNHFPNMHVICRKVHLFSLLSQMRGDAGGAVSTSSSTACDPGPVEAFIAGLYDFFPQSWSSKEPRDRRALEDFLRQLQEKKKQKNKKEQFSQDTPVSTVINNKKSSAAAAVAGTASKKGGSNSSGAVAVRTFIMKPNNACQGKGIIITRHPLQVMQQPPPSSVAGRARRASSAAGGAPADPATAYDPQQDYVIQLYVHRPLLIDRRKFDLRVYVLLRSLCNPCPQIFIHREGLVRLAGTEYQKPTRLNAHNAKMHLTNYTVNKTEALSAAAAAASASSLAPSADKAKSPQVPSPPVELKRDFAFLEKYVNTHCAHWVHTGTGAGTGAANAAGSDGGDDDDGSEDGEGDGGEHDASTRTDAGTAGGSGGGAGVARGPSLDRPPPCEGITPYHAMWQAIDRAVVLTILAALPQLMRSLSSAQVGLPLPPNLATCGTPTGTIPLAGAGGAGGLRGAGGGQSAGNTSSFPAVDGRSCFELMGFDVLLTESGRPYVLEVNHSPSLHCDAPIDHRVKGAVLSDVFRLLAPELADARKCIASAGDAAYRQRVTSAAAAASGRSALQRSGFRQVHPVPNAITEAEKARGYTQGKPFLLHREPPLAPWAVGLSRACGGVDEEAFSPFSFPCVAQRLNQIGDPFCEYLAPLADRPPAVGGNNSTPKEGTDGATRGGGGGAAAAPSSSPAPTTITGGGGGGVFSRYDPNAGLHPPDACYTPYAPYCQWLRHAYDTVLVSSGVFQGYRRLKDSVE